MAGGHYIIVCSCGKVLAQCRCFDPGKRREVIPNECDECRATKRKPRKELKQ